MTTTSADQVKANDTITAEWSGTEFTGTVRRTYPAVFSTRVTGVEHVTIDFIGGGFYGGDESISIPADQAVSIH